MSDFENFDVNADDYKINQTDYVVSENQAQAETLIETKPTEVIVEPEKKSETVSENNLTTEVVKSEDIKPVKVITPFKNTLLMNIQRLGVIINNISIVSFVLLVACVIGIILYPLAILINLLVIIFATIFTLGLIYLEVSFDTLFVVDGPFITNAVNFLMMAAPYVFGTLLATSAISLVLLLIDKRNISIPRVTLSILILLTVIVGIILLLLGVIGGAM